MLANFSLKATAVPKCLVQLLGPPSNSAYGQNNYV